MSLSRLSFAVAACLVSAPVVFAQASPSVFDGKSTAGWKARGDETKSRWTVGVAALTGKESNTGPLLFQGDHGPVAYRNINVTPKK